MQNGWEQFMRISKNTFDQIQAYEPVPFNPFSHGLCMPPFLTARGLIGPSKTDNICSAKTILMTSSRSNCVSLSLLKDFLKTLFTRKLKNFQLYNPTKGRIWFLIFTGLKRRAPKPRIFPSAHHRHYFYRYCLHNGVFCNDFISKRI